MAQAALAIAMAAGTWLAFSVPDAKGFNEPRLARIIFFHLPCAIITTIFLVAAAYSSLRYLQGRKWRWEVQAVAASEIGFLFAVLTMSTGILFSKVQWNAWWQWDPRQTSFLLVLFLFAGYFALRSAFVDERRRAANSAVYSVASMLPAFFLIFIFPRLPQVQKASFHPSQTVATGGFDPDYRTALLIVGALMLVVAVWLYRIRVRTGMAERAMEDFYERLDDRGHSADTRVVRPVPVPHQD